MGIIIKAAFILFITVSISGTSYAAGSETISSGCPETAPEPRIVVKITEPEMNIDNSVSIKKMQDMKITQYRDLFGKGVKTQVNGLTVSNVDIATTAEIDGIVEKRKGTGCIWVKKLNVFVKPKFRVIIPNKFKKGSCGYRQIYNHEMKHVAAEQITLREFIPYLERDLKKTITKIGVSRDIPENMTDVEAGKISKRIAKSNTVSFDVMNDSRRIRHESIDTLQEYTAVSKMIHEQCAKIDNADYNED